MTVLISINIVVLGTIHYDQSSVLSSIQENFNIAFFGIFALEAILKISALGKTYFQRWFNVLDLLIVLISGITIGMQVDGLTANILRVVRVLMKLMRVIRTAPWAADLRRILFAIVPALPSLCNIGVLLGLLYFVYAALGMSFFYNVRYQESINELANFRSIGSAFMTLFRATTGESWNGLMHDCMRNHCLLDGNEDGCGGFVVSLLFWYSFVVSTAFVVVNLFVAVILDNLGAIRRRPNLMQPESFTATWRRFDPEGILLLSWKDIGPLMDQLPPPIGFHCCAPHRFKVSKLLSLGIPVYGTKVAYSDVYEHLSSAVLDALSLGERPLAMETEDNAADRPEADRQLADLRLAGLKARHVMRILKRNGHLMTKSVVDAKRSLGGKGSDAVLEAKNQTGAIALLRRFSGEPGFRPTVSFRSSDSA